MLFSLMACQELSFSFTMLVIFFLFMLRFLRRIIPQDSSLRRQYSVFKSHIAVLVFGSPAKNMRLIAVTGTDGKTTTTEIIAHLLRSTSEKVLSISTAEINMNGIILPQDKRTTPSSWRLQKLFSQAKKEGIATVIMEVSSHAIVQRRIAGLLFDVAVLTNITHEHLDYHKTMKHYSETKKQLFTHFLKKDGMVILNVDDEYGKAWSEEFSNFSLDSSQREEHKRMFTQTQTLSNPPYQGGEIKTYSREGQKADIAATDITSQEKGIIFSAGKISYFLPMFGTFNVSNALAALLVLGVFQEKKSDLPVVLASFSGVPGRMERLDLGQDFQIFLDFAVTPFAFREMLTSAKTLGKRLITVFGHCGSHPDSVVRHELGKIAAEFSDIVLVTDDEPYFEDPAQIRSQILAGIFSVLPEEEQDETIFEISDRKVALEMALQKAHTGDVVVVSGMGHLTTRNIQGEEIPWSDKKVLQKVLQYFSSSS